MGEPAKSREVVTALVRASFLVSHVYAESAREYGLTVQQGHLLCVLMARPYGMRELGATLGLARSSLSELVDRTAERGLVQRAPDPDDRRAVRVTLTEQGRELADVFYPATCARIEQIPSALDGTERGTLADLLTRVVDDNDVPMIFLGWDTADQR